MSENLLENDFSVELKSATSGDTIRVDVDYAKEYREYKNNVLVKSIAVDDDELLLILLENQLLDFKQQGFFCVPPPYTPDGRLELCENYIEQINSDDDCEYLLGADKEIYLRISELDLVSVHDVYSRLCVESRLPELQLPAERLNCIHVGILRRFFYQPEATKLGYLVMDCGFDSLSAILTILADAKVQRLPVSLNLDCECSKDHRGFQDAALLENISIRSLGCGFVEHLFLFKKSLPDLVDLNLFNLSLDAMDGYFYRKDAKSGLDYLKTCYFPKLKFLFFHNIANREELEQLLNLQCIKNLEELHITGSEYASSNLPIEYLLKESVIPKWQHLKKILLDGHYVYEDVRQLFKEYPQIVFY